MKNKLAAVLLSVATITLSGCEAEAMYSNDDLKIVENYIMGEEVLSEKQLEKLDLNEDGEITSLDYVLIKKELTVE